MSRDIPGASGNYLSVSDVAAIDITGTALTVCCWINLDVNNATQDVVAKYGSSPLQYLLRINNSGQLSVFIGDGGNDNAVGGTTIGTGSWKHVALRKNGTGAGALKGYLNGVEEATATSNRSIADTSNPLTFGAAGDDTDQVNGRIAEVAIWNIALSPAEIAQIAAGKSPLSIQPANLKGYWPLYGNVSPETDLSGSGNNATIVGTVPAGTDPDLVNNPAHSATAAQSLTSSETTTVSQSQTATHTMIEFVGFVESVSTSQQSSQSFGLTELPVVRINIDGIDPGNFYVVDGDEFLVDNLDERTFFEIVSQSAAPQDLTIYTTYIRDDLELEDRVVTIPAGAKKYLGVFPGFIYNENITTLRLEQDNPGAIKIRALLLTS